MIQSKRDVSGRRHANMAFEQEHCSPLQGHDSPRWWVGEGEDIAVLVVGYAGRLHPNRVLFSSS